MIEALRRYNGNITCDIFLHGNESSPYNENDLFKNAISIYDLDLTKPTAIVLGNEHSGVSEEVQLKSNIKAFIPMFGLVQSLNVSVATGVAGFEFSRIYSSLRK